VTASIRLELNHVPGSRFRWLTPDNRGRVEAINASTAPARRVHNAPISARELLGSRVSRDRFVGPARTWDSPRDRSLSTPPIRIRLIGETRLDCELRNNAARSHHADLSVLVLAKTDRKKGLNTFITKFGSAERSFIAV